MSCFFHMLFEFHFLNEDQQAISMLLGLPAENGCLHQVLRSWVLISPFWYSGLEQQLGPPISHSFEETLRETRFSFEVSWLPFMKWEPSLGLVFFCTFCSYCQCKVCKCALPVSRISPRARASGLSWAECIVTQSEMQLREV